MEYPHQRKLFSFLFLGLFVLGSGGGCGGGSDTVIPGIGPDASQSAVENVDYRLGSSGEHCPPGIAPPAVLISQGGETLTAKVGDQTVATGSLDPSGKVKATLLSPDPSAESLDCSGTFKAGVFDMTCPITDTTTCDFTYKRADLI